MDSHEADFGVLVVCTGNVCRSPVIEGVLRDRFRGRPISVSSAGVAVRPGELVTPDAARLLEELGAAPVDRAPVQLVPEMIEGADLIITADRTQRAAVARAVPRAARNVFTLIELARLVESVRDDEQAVARLAAVGPITRTLRAAVPVIAAQRGYAPPPDRPEEDDIVDPYGRRAAVYDRAGQQIARGVQRIVEAIDDIVRILSAPAQVIGEGTK